MDYTEDYFMDHFTFAQSERMNDVWQAYRVAAEPTVVRRCMF